MISDQTERQTALDPRQSFIVQAPAGSGKTELLVQRFLTLLSYVQKPEEILAITFTNKAAYEMRERIINALQSATNPTSPTAPHQAHTWQLARAALKQNDQLQWQLLQNPRRLRIQTVDAFSSSINHRLPILSQAGGTLAIASDPDTLYQEAIRDFLASLEESNAWSLPLQHLLAHLDNNHARVETLLIDMLKKRDHWLPYLTLPHQNDNLREQLEASLQNINQDTLDAIDPLFSASQKTQLLNLLVYASSFIDPEHPIASFKNQTCFPSAELHNKEQWLAIAELLLTTQLTWRKQVSKTIGFPARTFFKNKDEKITGEAMKTQLKTLLEDFSTHDELRNLLALLKTAPPLHYSEKQWEILQALLTVLPVAVAYLKLHCQAKNELDFTEVSLSALHALGSDEQPTDLALYFDYQLKHILVDEFQDTSITQLRLLEKLTLEWMPDDERSLFLVGDPMQSIYRFRNAEVGLFLQAQRNGVNAVKLHPLKLTENFRSSQSIVTWINDTFSCVFPEVEDISSGAVTFSASNAALGVNTQNVAFKQNLMDPVVKPRDDRDPTTSYRGPTTSYRGLTAVSRKASHCINDNQSLSLNLNHTDPQQEAKSIIHIIKNTLKQDTNTTIGILVQARSQLTEIISHLHQHRIAFNAVDISPLKRLPHLQDLFALTRALLHPEDTIAWYSILRAPWCGLSLASLLAIESSEPETPYEKLKHLDDTASLPPDEHQRLQAFLACINQALSLQGRKPLAAWIEDTWIDLGGAETLSNEQALNDCHQYWALLNEVDLGGDILFMETLEKQLSKYYAIPLQKTAASVSLMTIHKSKGLEFDTVILPRLERPMNRQDAPLLLWTERTRPSSGSDLVLAPIRATEEKSDAIYHYLAQLEKQRYEHESRRLFYVAATRAKSALHLSACMKENLRIPSNSFLSYLIQNKNNAAHLPKELKTTTQPTDDNFSHTFKKRALKDYPPIKNNLFEGHNALEAGALLWDKQQQAHIGSIIHRLLQYIGENQLLDKKMDPTFAIKNLLSQYGLDAQDKTLIQHLTQIITRCLVDKKACWILSQHDKDFFEYPVTANLNGHPQHLVIDRAFIENETLWVVDYKTSKPTADETLEAFLQQQSQQHQKQLNLYMRTLSALYPGFTIKSGIYFPVIQVWLEHDPTLVHTVISQ